MREPRSGGGDGANGRLMAGTGAVVRRKLRGQQQDICRFYAGVDLLAVQATCKGGHVTALIPIVPAPGQHRAVIVTA